MPLKTTRTAKLSASRRNAAPERRRFLACFSSLGLASTLLPDLLWAALQQQPRWKISADMLADAERVAGLEFTPRERESVLNTVNENLARYEAMRAAALANSEWPALQFTPLLPGIKIDVRRPSARPKRRPAPALPSDLEEIAFWPVADLAALIRTRKISSQELTKMYLARLRRIDAKLKCVVTLTEDLALRQARRADEEISRGRTRGPLHGIPWGAKDLIAVREYRTTWGAAPFKDQILDLDATVAERLEAAGAVLIAKLATGELASGDVWFGGRTKTPWNLNEGARGSSAGPAAATAAGLVGFSIGTETRGSITFPCARCGVTGLRPTFGRVSRHGVMAITFSMDKVGPICRSAEDCALVLGAILGPDGKDAAVVDLPFNWNLEMDTRRLRVGYIRSAFEEPHESAEGKENDLATLEALRNMGWKLEPVEYPDYPVDVQAILSDGERGAAFDDVVRNRKIDQLAAPLRFRRGRLLPAVEYIQADRIRVRLMREMARMMAQIDVCVTPVSAPGMPSQSAIGRNVPLTNLTGIPGVILPNGFSASTGLPTAISFIGKPYEEEKILALARAYQNATDFHQRRPPLQG
ncbi:MAG: amidase [Acidobacteria bacterium]|nr:amidase [Acidobacteriota bacterium]